MTRRTAVVSVVAVVIALSAVTTFIVSLTHTLQSIDRHEAHLVVLQRQANQGLARIEPKVRRLATIGTKATALSRSLTGVGDDLVGVNGQVGGLDRDLGGVARRLAGVSARLAGLSGNVDGLSGTIGTISTGLGGTAADVSQLTGDVNRIATALGAFPRDLVATNRRLDYVNDVVGGMGRQGVTSAIGLTVHQGGALMGHATITAVLIPAGAWH